MCISALQLVLIDHFSTMLSRCRKGARSAAQGAFVQALHRYTTTLLCPERTESLPVLQPKETRQNSGCRAISELLKKVNTLQFDMFRFSWDQRLRHSSTNPTTWQAMFGNHINTCGETIDLSWTVSKMVSSP